ncbi:Thioredoxin-like protein [Dioscorea alata]|uniref:Thioredoxin-like protein n=1 Tax=Dioscorea alata TaxID=55571 RepID=A0ACB7VBG1_DIOAL|nr:Thioredoxin-like protein [Dioscorea alata]
MEGSTSSFEYKGSIADAINAARRDKKLFVVCISGEDENSILLEQSTWVDSSVVDSISKYCIFLHLKQGSLEASQFSAIYPQQSFPSITAIGCNGLVLWKHEGYVNAENFLENIEKAWAAFHLQGATAMFVAAALASKQPEPANLTSANVVPCEEGSSSSMGAATASAEAEKPSVVIEARPLTIPEAPVDQKVGEQHALQDHEPVEGSSIPNEVHDHNINKGTQFSSPTCSVADSFTTPQGTANENNAPHTTESVEGTYSNSPINPQETSLMDIDEPDNKNQMSINEMAVSSNAIKSNEIHLNIRLPDGSTLQTKFSISDTLSLVKNYVDENQSGTMGPYALAVPYPRKVFGEQDMFKSLSELEFSSRQAIIVVPHRQNIQPRGVQSTNNVVRVTDSIQSSEGYFGYVKRILSYANPFAYFGGNANSSSSQAIPPNDGLWQYSPNPSLQNQLNRESPPRGDTARNPRSTSRPFGSNIHTLRHDEDQLPPGDRNTFWNGNSTQFGGNNNDNNR